MRNILYKIIRKINFIYHSLFVKAASSFYYVYFHLLGIKCGKSMKVCNRLSVHLTEGSNIYIGNNCHFISNSYFNHLGIQHSCILSTETPHATISIGNSCGFSGTSINCFCSIKIGNHVRFGANTKILDGDFHLDDPRTPAPKPIIIENNVWLGGGVVVMKGVTIGENSIIGMNSIVTKSIPANVIAAGNPCKVIKHIDIAAHHI